MEIVAETQPSPSISDKENIPPTTANTFLLPSSHSELPIQPKLLQRGTLGKPNSESGPHQTNVVRAHQLASDCCIEKVGGSRVDELMVHAPKNVGSSPTEHESPAEFKSFQKFGGDGSLDDTPTMAMALDIVDSRITESARDSSTFSSSISVTLTPISTLSANATSCLQDQMVTSPTKPLSPKRTRTRSAGQHQTTGNNISRSKKGNDEVFRQKSKDLGQKTENLALSPQDPTSRIAVRRHSISPSKGRIGSNSEWHPAG